MLSLSGGRSWLNEMLESMAAQVPNLRVRRFFQAVASGYVQLFAATFYVLASVPLALHYLQKREFGLWALAMQLGGYLQLIDFGMSSSVSRHLIDHKDHREGGLYGGMIKTGGLVLAVQGVLVLLAGVLVIAFGTRLLRIDPDLEGVFETVMIFQCVIIAADFPARLFNHVLVAHQRADITNYAQIAFFFVSFISLWYCFAHGFGVYSLIWANLAGWLVITFSNAISCLALKILPSAGNWGVATWSNFRELFGFGKDIFWIALGTQMINASQTIVITRAIGLNSAATWSVCTRTFTFANQLVWRPFDFSYPMLSEMVARDEKDRLLYRFRNLVNLTTSLAVAGAFMFALCNQPFVQVWTQGKISWPVLNDALLAIWMIILALVHCHCSLVLITKRIGFMRYIYFVEGVSFLFAGSYAASKLGFTGLLLVSVLCTTLFTLSYGLRRTVQEFNLTFKEVAFRWVWPSIRLLLLMAIVAVPLYWVAQRVSFGVRLVFFAVILGAAGALLFLREGLSLELRSEFKDRAPVGIGWLLKKLFPT